jgi:hypothetical protein
LKLRSLCALLLVAIGTAGCDEFDNLTDINENPNAPTSLAPEFLLPSLIRGIADELIGESNIDLPSASLFAQHAARIQYAGTDRYDLGTDYGSDFWDSYWDLSGDPPEGAFVLSQLMVDQAVELGDANQTAVAMILRAYAAHNLTDMYGDVPYFEAVKGASENAVIRPVYDSQSAIYDDLFTQLTAATTMINVGASGFPGGDLIYSGDMDKWRRFGNSLRLRLAMRISEVNPTKAASEAAAAVAAGVMEDDSHSAALWYSASAPDNNPMWLGFVERPGDYRPAAFFIDEMLARNDPRVRMHADATVDGHGQMYRGMPNGYNDDRGFDANGERDFDYVSQVGAWHLRPEAPAFFMEYAETLLLQAEAADRGWISGSAKDFYEAGIAASMRVYADGCAADCGAFVTPAVPGITQAEIDAYLAHPMVAWDGGGIGGESNRSLIYRAYWFQLWDQGLEAYNKYRRTNVPHLIPGIDSFNALVPQRYPYPRDEQTFNETNVLAAIAANGGNDAWDGRVWWDASDQNSGPAN